MKIEYQASFNEIFECTKYITIEKCDKWEEKKSPRKIREKKILNKCNKERKMKWTLNYDNNNKRYLKREEKRKKKQLLLVNVCDSLCML